MLKCILIQRDQQSNEEDMSRDMTYPFPNQSDLGGGLSNIRNIEKGHGFEINFVNSDIVLSLVACKSPWKFELMNWKNSGCRWHRPPPPPHPTPRRGH